MTRTGTLPTEEATRQALADLAEINALSQAMDQATRRGGHVPEIHSLMTAAAADDGAVTIHGVKLYLPTFGALQILDEIESPLLTGGSVKLGQIAAAICVLEAPEACWRILSGPDGQAAFNSRVWERTKSLTPPVATQISEAMIGLIRQACGIATPDAEVGNGGTQDPKAGEPVRTPAGLPPSSSDSWQTTDAPSPTPSGACPPQPPANSLMPVSNGLGAPPPALQPLTAPASPPSAPAAPGSPVDQRIFFQGEYFANKQELSDYLYNRAANPD